MAGHDRSSDSNIGTWRYSTIGRLAGPSTSKVQRRILAVVFHLLLGLAILPSPAVGHGAIHDRIVKLNTKIAADPGNARLYLKRGELYQAERHWQEALDDYARASELDPELAAVELARSNTLLDADQPALALAAIDRFLASDPESSRGRVVRARALSLLGRHAEAAVELTRTLENRSPSERPNPEVYLLRGRAIAAAGGDLGAAVRGLDEGMALLGPLMTLQLLAVDLERAAEQFDAALTRVDQIASQSPRKESWWLMRGEILDQAGRAQEAQQAYTQALTAIESLPGNHRRTKGTLRLEARIRAALAHRADPSLGTSQNP